jgi:gluconate 2-dehydrogenase gamma chain
MKPNNVKLQRRTVLGLLALGLATESAKTAALEAADGLLAPPSKPANSRSIETTGTAAFTVLQPAEASFISAAVDTLIPADELTPSGSECGIVVFIDRQLGGLWGAGARSYRSGPFLQGPPELGDQSPLTPLEFFKDSIRRANTWCRHTYGADFDQLTVDDRESALGQFEHGLSQEAAFNSVRFFEQLRRLTVEGFLADPIYGGNRNKVSWQMIGYPGLPSFYANYMTTHQKGALQLPPKSIADFS